MKVLIVEDNPLNLKLFSETLAMKGFEIITARNGNEALESLKVSIPDIIILDLYMPSMSGFRFANTISKDLRYHDIPIIVVSASSSIYDVKEMASYNVKAYLVKPVSPTKLLETVKKVIVEKELIQSPPYYSSKKSQETKVEKTSVDEPNTEPQDSAVKKEVETSIRVSVDDLIEGMILGEPIMKNRAIVYKEGTRIDDKIIEKLKSLGIRDAYITKKSFEEFKDLIDIKNDEEDIFGKFKE